MRFAPRPSGSSLLHRALTSLGVADAHACIAASCIGASRSSSCTGLMLVGTGLWLVNNLLVGSIGGTLLEAC